MMAVAATDLTLPHPEEGAGSVRLGARGFVLDGEERRVLRYPVGASGWSDHLTALHEEHDTEGRHYIDVASRRYAASEVLRMLGGRTGATVMEVGVSSGHFLRELRRRVLGVRVLGADYTDSRLDSLSSEMPDVAFLRFDLTRCPLPDRSVDVIVALNVLEHIEDDAAAARQIARVLKPGGAAVIEVPAGPELYDDYDRKLMHFRRYRMPDVVALFERAGLVVERRSHLGFFLFPAFWAVKQISKARAAPASDVDAQHANAEKAMDLSRMIGPLGNMVMGVEGALRRVAPLPFGIRCLVTARNPG